MVATSSIRPGSADNGTVGASGTGPGLTGTAEVVGAGIAVEVAVSSGLAATLIAKPAAAKVTTAAAPTAIGAHLGQRRRGPGANAGG
ncbi:hypothetical protein A5695_19825 [Mycobacterium sp. E1747]|nr:hypothetical protein A5695_19825 [Mycobacterium sp. E1747]